MALGGDEGDRAERASVRNKRHAHPRPQIQRPQDVHYLRQVPRRLRQEVVGDVAYELRLARSQDLRNAVGGVGARSREPLRKLLRPADLLRIGVRDNQPLHAPRLLDDVDGAPVGELRHGERRDVLQRRLVVERRGEDRARLGEEAPLLGRLRLLFIEARRGDRSSGEVRERGRGAPFAFGELVPAAVVEGERAEDLLVMDERSGEHRLVPLSCVRSTVCRCQPLGRGDVLGDQRLVERHLRSEATNRLRRGLDVLV